MKPGFVSAILPELSLEELTDLAAQLGYKCIEVCCWPVGTAERRYAGVTHIDVENLDQAKADNYRTYMAGRGVEISGLGYYPNPLDPDPEKRDFFFNHIRKVIDASVLLGVKKVNTFIGRDKNRNIEENFELFRQYWPGMIRYAEERGVKVGIENCPMIFTYDEWPGGCNLATTPSMWRRMFAEINSDSFGLNFDPSHMVWQQIDYIKPLYEFRNKLFHIHLKDASIDISFGGVALKVDRRLNIGKEYLFKLGENGNSIDVKGVVARCKLSRIEERFNGEPVSIYTAGMKFKEGSEEKVADFIRSSVLA